MKRFFFLLLAFVAFGSATLVGQTASSVRLLGADLSMLPAYEAAGVSYKDADGAVQSDPLLFFRDVAGIRCVRVRLFVDPTGETGVVQDLDFVKAFGRRIKQAGLRFMLDFHYSDTWADPAQQYIPRSWPTDAASLQQKIYSYTTAVLQALSAAGATPDYIQVGNEVSFGLCSMRGTYNASTKKWTTTATSFGVNAYQDANWATFLSFLQAGCAACREQCPLAKIVIHTEQAGNAETTRRYYQRLATLDYDVVGLSYYPFWHKSLSVLGQTLSSLETSFPTKEVMIVETAYNNAWYPTGEGITDFQSIWPATPAGQQKFVEDLIAMLRQHANVTGLFYWMPEENPYNNHVYEPWLNRGLFNNGFGDEWPRGNRALPAFYSLKKFTEGQADGIIRIGDGESVNGKCVNGKCYDLSGRSVAVAAPGLQRGVYILGGRKYQVR